ncbi:mannosyl-3-phosphoglycerate synthase [Pyrenophora teres f. maculata]|nr:mannosyl-3-phosphoglycerate synthase [Pyrenophora teres f. maculata]
MRLRTNSRSTQIGNVEIHDLFHVLELEGGYPIDEDQHPHPRSNTFNKAKNSENVSFSTSSLYDIESQLAIIVPCMNEEQHIIEGVLRGIPHHCLVVLVSNSSHAKFEEELELLKQLCDDTQRQGIVIHQQNEALALAFCAAGMPEVVEQTVTPQRIRNGKGEAMIIGVLIAKLAGKQFVGFVDADNLIPGSVHEYCKVFASGLKFSLQNLYADHSTQAPPVMPKSHAMVRIKWNSKPKVVNNKILFPKTGRSSRVVNEWMNKFLQAIHGREACEEAIQTANAGEHAIDIHLALKLRFATGYAVEPFQYIDILENFGHIPPCGYGRTQGDDGKDNVAKGASEDDAIGECSSDETKVRILQVRTCNPHFHDTGKGEGHIERMITQGLSTIYQSRLAPQTLKDDLYKITPTVNGYIRIQQDLLVYPSMRKIDLEVFRRKTAPQIKTFNCSLGETSL